MRTTRGQLESMTTTVVEMLRARGDQDADRIALDYASAYGGYMLVVHNGADPKARHQGISTSRFGEGRHSASEMWEILRGMQRALEGVPTR